MNKRRRLLLVAVPLVVAACGADTDDSIGPAPSTEPSTAVAPSATD